MTLVGWVFFALRYVFNLRWYHGLLVSVIFYCFALLLRVAQKHKFSVRSFSKVDIFVYSLLFLLILTLVHCCTIRNGIYSAGTVYSDIPFHMSLITSFAYGTNSNGNMSTPFYAGAKLCYPFIPDYISTVLFQCGLSSLRVSIALPTMIMFISLIIGLHRTFLHFSSNKMVINLAIMLFFFVSGGGWKYMAIHECLTNPNSNAVHQFCHDKSTFWIHTVVHFLLPQRSALFSTPIVLYTIQFLLCFVESNFQDRSLVFFAGVLTSFVPMISAHSFIAIGEYSIILCIITFPWLDNKKWYGIIVSWSLFALPILIFGFPQALYLLSGDRKTMMSFDPIWHETSENRTFEFFWMWYDSLGPFIIISIFGVWITFNQKRQKLMYIPSLIIWIVSNFIRYQPGAMDNTKVYIVGWLPFASAAVAQFYVVCIKSDYFQKYKTVKVLLLIILITSFLSSIVAIAKFVGIPFGLYNDIDKDAGMWIAENTRNDRVFLSSEWHSNVAMSIGGRQIAIGFYGWIWTHGLDLNSRLAKVTYLASQSENITAFNEMNIDYLILRPEDKSKNFNFPKPSLSSIWQCIYDMGSLEIYKIVEEKPIL